MAAAAAVEQFFFSSRRRHTRSKRDWSSDVCSSDLAALRLVVLLLTDLAVAQQEEAERVLGGVRGREDDVAVLPDECPLHSFVAEDELPAATDHRDETQHIRELDAREIALKDWGVGHRTNQVYPERSEGSLVT